MGIYSSNRSKSMTISQIPANENYTDHDFGRILYESVQNDQIIFEAMMQNDFNELKAIKEGTLLESELAALNEENKEGFFKTLLKRVREFFAKIQGALRSAFNKINIMITKNGKLALDEFDKVAKAYKGDNFSTKEEVKVPKRDFKISYDISDLIKYVDSNIDNEEFNKKVDLGTQLTNLTQSNNFAIESKGGHITPNDFKKSALKAAFEMKTVSLNSQELQDIRHALINNKYTAEEIRDNEKDVKKKINEIEKIIKSANDKTDASKISKLISVVEGVVTTVTSANISILKSQVIVSISILRGMAKEMNKRSNNTEVQNNSAFIEAAIEAETEYEEIDNDITDEIEDDQEVKDIE